MITDVRPANLGGLKALSEEVLPSFAAAGPLFSNVPAGAIGATFTIRSSPVTLTFAGTVPVAGVTGTDYDLNTYDFYMGVAALKAIQCIQNGGTATGFVTYWGLN